MPIPVEISRNFKLKLIGGVNDSRIQPKPPTIDTANGISGTRDTEKPQSVGRIHGLFNKLSKSSLIQKAETLAKAAVEKATTRPSVMGINGIRERISLNFHANTTTGPNTAPPQESTPTPIRRTIFRSMINEPVVGIRRRYGDLLTSVNRINSQAEKLETQFVNREKIHRPSVPIAPPKVPVIDIRRLHFGNPKDIATKGIKFVKEKDVIFWGLGAASARAALAYTLNVDFSILDAAAKGSTVLLGGALMLEGIRPGVIGKYLNRLETSHPGFLPKAKAISIRALMAASSWSAEGIIENGIANTFFAQPAPIESAATPTANLTSISESSPTLAPIDNQTSVSPGLLTYDDVRELSLLDNNEQVNNYGPSTIPWRDSPSTGFLEDGNITNTLVKEPVTILESPQPNAISQPEVHPIPPTISPNGAEVSGSVLDNSLKYDNMQWEILQVGENNIMQLSDNLGQQIAINQQVLAERLQQAVELHSRGQLNPSDFRHLDALFNLANGTESVFDELVHSQDTLESLRSLRVI